MSFIDSLFGSSFWSYETAHKVVLHRPSDVRTPPDDIAATHSPERQSRFSISSDEDHPTSSGSFNAVRSPLSLGSQQTGRRDKPLPPVPREHSLARQQRGHASVRCSGLRAIDEISWPMPPGTKPPPRTPRDSGYMASKMSRIRVGLFISTICTAQLCARELNV